MCVAIQAQARADARCEVMVRRPLGRASEGLLKLHFFFFGLFAFLFYVTPYREANHHGPQAKDERAPSNEIGGNTCRYNQYSDPHTDHCGGQLLPKDHNPESQEYSGSDF